MYQKGYGIIETLAPLHVGATAGEESGNLNLIFRDSFTQTGIIPGSSIRGRLRADMRFRLQLATAQSGEEDKASDEEPTEVKSWYGAASEKSRQENYDYESAIKIEHASIVWLPVFCPGQPVVWVSSQRLLERYKRIAGINEKVPDPYTSSSVLEARPLKKKKNREVLLFNFGFLEIKRPKQNLSKWFPDSKEKPAVIVDDKEIGIVHDLALYRQSRVALELNQKINAQKAFFNVEALPEGTILAFPVALKPTRKWQDWKPLDNDKEGDIYLGGLESVGFGHCSLKIHQVSQEVNK